MWTNQGDVWRRIDGVRVKPDHGSAVNSFCVVDPTGAKMMHPHASRCSVVRRFKTVERAMGSADRNWPVRAE